jgi:hypothetical protein
MSLGPIQADHPPREAEDIAGNGREPMQVNVGPSISLADKVSNREAKFIARSHSEGPDPCDEDPTITSSNTDEASRIPAIVLPTPAQKLDLIEVSMVGPGDNLLSCDQKRESWLLLLTFSSPHTHCW